MIEPVILVFDSVLCVQGKTSDRILLIIEFMPICVILIALPNFSLTVCKLSANRHFDDDVTPSGVQLALFRSSVVTISWWTLCLFFISWY